MATLTPGIELAQRVPALLVENSLAPGAWTFRLVVVDNDGNPSAPIDLVVNVVRRIIPVPIPTPKPSPGPPPNPRPIPISIPPIIRRPT